MIPARSRSGGRLAAASLGLLACALCAGAKLAAQDAARVQALAAEGRYREAWRALETVGDAVTRLEAEASLRYGASDPGGALRAAESGLALAPDHLLLRFRAAASALWLGAGERAREHARALDAAVADAELSEADRAAWRTSAEDFLAEAERVVALEEQREQAVSRARGLSLAGLGGLVTALSWALIARPRRAREEA